MIDEKRFKLIDSKTGKEYEFEMTSSGYKKQEKFGVDSIDIIRWIVLFQNCCSMG